MHQLERRILPRADEEPAPDRVSSDPQRRQVRGRGGARSTADQRDDFQHISRREGPLRVRAPPHEVTIDFDGHELWLQLQMDQKLGDSHRRGHLAALAVKRDLQGRSQDERLTGGHPGHGSFRPGVPRHP